MHRNFKHIELFAGCGGLSLGLEAAGFDLFMANELSPMAAETFIFNLFDENLLTLADEKRNPEKALWIKSKYPKENLKERLRENTFEYSKGTYTDIDNKTNFSRKLIIGDIDNFLSFLGENKKVAQQFKNLNIDLLSGGPPCQGFSMAGKRIKDDYKNLLPLSFARFAGLIEPKVVLLENVKGITSPFTAEDGLKHYAWLEIAKAFSLEGFYPVCMLVNSKYFGVPQNRPRFILFAFREDIFNKLKKRNNNSAQTNLILNNTQIFFEKVHDKEKQLDDISIKDILLYKIESHQIHFDGELLPKITNKTLNEFVKTSDAIGDITSTRKTYKLNNIKNKYALRLLNFFASKNNNELDELQNHEYRNHRYSVKARFRLYQVLSNFNGLKHETVQLISGNCENQEILQKIYAAFLDEPLILTSEGGIDVLSKPGSLDSFREYLKKIGSKKHSQRSLKSNEPAHAQMTIPDDLCHYSPNELRTLTVREMARIQSFPDWFVFRSKVTTGGRQRKYEVPQYTQVGNAVPPLLAYELGITIKRLLDSIEL